LYVFALYFASMTLARDAVMSQTWDHQSQQDMSWLCMSLLLLR
jgi:phage terminase large subunit GpA-like protein